MSLPEHELTVQAADPTAEIVVYDASFNRVGRGVGRYTAVHPDGLYEIRVRTAGTQEEKLISLARNEIVTMAPVLFASAVPLAATATTDDAHEEAVVRASKAPVARGAGSGVLIAVRDRPGRRSDPIGTGSPAAGLTLRDPNGNLVFDFGRDAPVDSSGSSPVAAVYLHVDPGVYRLRLAPPNGSARERTIFTSAKWSTQCFLVRRSHGQASIADLDQGSISLSKLDAPFAADDRRTRLSEAARDALADNRKVAEAASRALMNEKFQDPMLGLLVGHLLLRDRASDEVLPTVIDNLVDLLGPKHPDVQALMLATSHSAAPDMVTDMPMLRASWDAIVTRTVTQPHLVPSDSSAAAVSTRVLPSFPWLVWEALDTKAATRVNSKMAALRSYVARAPTAGAAQESLVPGDTQIGYTAPNLYRPRDDWRQRVESWIESPPGGVGSWQAEIGRYWQWTTVESVSPENAWARLHMAPINAKSALDPNSLDRGLIPPELFSRVLARAQATVIDPNADVAAVVIDEPSPARSFVLNIEDRQELVRSLGVPASVLGDMLSKLE